MCREGEVMNEEFALGAKRGKKLKEEILDESFKKAEISRGIRLPDKKPSKKSYEKTFPKLGVLLIIFAIIGLIFIYNVPWAYIKYDTGEEQVEASIYRNFEGAGSENQQILDLFRSPHYIGLSIDDFTDMPTSASYGFILLIVLGVILTLFGILDKIRNFSLETSIIIHFIFAIVTIVTGTFIVLSVIKILGSHFLLGYNMPLIPDLSNIILFFPAAFVVVVFGFIIVKLAFTIMRMDFNELQKIKEIGTTSEQSFSQYAQEGKFQ